MISQIYNFSDDIYGRRAQSIVSSLRGVTETVSITKDGRTVNGASLLGVLSLNIKSGDEVTIRVSGQSAADEIRVINNYIKVLQGE